MKAIGRLWAVVLAGGVGRRLAPITRVLYGHALPKQFAALDGDRSFLQQTLDRIAPLVPSERTVVVVSEVHSALARQQLRGYSGVAIVAQPEDRGTGPGVLLPLCHVRARDSNAEVVVLPSDHHVRRAGVFLKAVGQALAAAGTGASGLALIGATAEGPATDLGWIVPKRTAGINAASAWGVARFVEKPPLPEACTLMEEGGLWNTMMVVGRVQALWRQFRRHLPRQTSEIEQYSRKLAASDARATLEAVYRRLEPADFSRTILQAAQGLSMVPLVDAGWSDCGTPARLFECLRGTRALESLVARLGHAGGDFSRAAGLR